MIRILIGGDICPIGKVQAAFVAGRAGDIFHDLLPEIQSADLALVNLECPLVPQCSPISKASPVLGAPPECIHGFVDAQWDILNLANNHSFDHGAAGFHETLEAIRKAGLTSVGAGNNLAEAQEPVIRTVNDRRIVVYSMAEREFSVADETTPGANPLDLINFVHAVRQHKEDGIFIALVHGGKEYYPYPTPEMVRRCRFMVDMGADAVICCHTHCPLPWEQYRGRPIVYGLGNLIFEPLGPEPQSWHQGYLARLQIDGDHVAFEPVPYLQSSGATGATAMNEADARALREQLLKRSDELKNPALLQRTWKEFCLKQEVDYLSMLFAYSPMMDRLRRVLLPLLHSDTAVQQSLLLLQCETHREILETIFRDKRARG